MSEAQEDGGSDGSSSSESTGGKGRGGRMGDGIRQGIGVLSAFRDALEETIQEARDRGDLSTDRAKEVMKEALEKAQEAADGAKERLDFVSQADFDSLAEVVEGLAARVAELEAGIGSSSSPVEGDPPD